MSEKPERAVWLAIIGQAIADLRNRNPDIRAEAERWLTSPTSTLRLICRILQINHEAIRSRYGRRLDAG